MMVSSRFVRSLVSGLSPFWAIVNAVVRPTLSRNAWQAPVPVISIGNILAGGTGKTEVASLIAAKLVSEGKRVVIAMRGYTSGRSVARDAIAMDLTSGLEQAFPDEALVHLAKVPGVMIAVGSDRAAVLKKHWNQLQPDVVLLDDGLQHFGMARNLDVVVHDFSVKQPILRDFPGFFERVKLRVAVAGHLGELHIPKKWAHLPWIQAHYELNGLKSWADNAAPTAPLPGRAFAFCGIGNPLRFRETLISAGVEVEHFVQFDDHATYDPSEIRILNQRYAQFGHGHLPGITTLKDYVKIFRRESQLGFKLWYTDAHLKLVENEALLWDGVRGVFS